MTDRAALERQRELIDAQLTRLDRYPAEDPYREGTVLRFRIKYASGPRRYRFAAVKAGGKWYATGRNSSVARTWDEFVAYLTQGDATDLEPMIPRRKLEAARAGSKESKTATRQARLEVTGRADADVAKGLFEDLRAVTVNAGAPAHLLVPHLVRLLAYARRAVTAPSSEDAASFVAAVLQYDNSQSRVNDEH